MVLAARALLYDSLEAELRRYTTNTVRLAAARAALRLDLHNASDWNFQQVRSILSHPVHSSVSGELTNDAQSSLLLAPASRPPRH